MMLKYRTTTARGGFLRKSFKVHDSTLHAGIMQSFRCKIAASLPMSSVTDLLLESEAFCGFLWE